ncbi:uncharacterized protein LOC135139224 isoform X2 [Zophobas morio]|uniref:uncharacterized protein LOC135139224 isoform X2 n=1 Tax=Zophobas morio TaxID=2755281 RepID=UPI003083C402
MPIQAPQWTEFLSCPVCCNAFDVAHRSPISLGCGHTVCKTCLSNLHRKQCPFDQTTISIDIESLPVNTALLQLVGPLIKKDDDAVDQKIVSRDNVAYYQDSRKCVEELAMYLKPHPNGNVCGSGSILSRPMQRKLVTLINCQLVEDEGRTRAMRAARSLGERTVTELILQHQNPQQLSANLWAAVRARGCQFLGPAMQEEVLKLVLLALEDGSALSRKVLVMFVVQRLEPHFPQASKTSIGHVVQLLYRASCFKVSKREGDSSLMQLKEEFRTYEALRREHDAQIVQIATEAGLRIAPDQWSALLYGDTAHKSHMQSIIDKLQTPQSFAQSVQELVIALQRTGDPGKLSVLRTPLELLAGIDPSPESSTPTWKECSEALEAVRLVVAGLVEFIHQHGSRKLQDTTHSQHAKYKISMCRDLTLRGNCPRGTNCTFAHSNEELEKYRAKNRKTIIRNKEHRIDSQSPTEKVYPQTEDYYSMPNTATVSPVPIPAVVQIQRIGYDVAFNHNLPPYAPQPMYAQTGTPYSHEVYSTAPPNIVLTNNDQFYPQQTDYTNIGHQSNQNADKRTNWDNVISKNQNVMPSTKRSSTKSLAELHQRKQEVLSQLEKVVGKNAATAISHNATSMARQESQHDLDSPTSPYTFWTGHVNSGPTFVRSDSILAADDDYVPYDSPAISKYGPISRMHKDNGQVSSFRDGNMSSPLSDLNYLQPSKLVRCGFSVTLLQELLSKMRRPLASASPVTSLYYNNNPPPFHQGSIPPGHAIVGHPGSGLGSPQLIYHQRMQDPSKELLAESQRVKLQLCNLEKQLNDLKLATQGVTTLSERDRLTQELQLIEQGIQEKQKEACLNKIVHSWNQAMGNYNNANVANLETSEEAMYEADIANDMRQLEIRLQEEIEEQEKIWSSEEDSNQ